MLGRNTQVVTQKWTSDSGKGHINDTHLSYTCVVMGKNTLESHTWCVHRRVIRTENQIQRKLPVGRGQRKGTLWGRNLFSGTKLKSRMTRGPE